MPRIEIRRADQRQTTRAAWLESRHSFSFAHHDDLLNLHHHLRMVNNDDIVQPKTGFMTHLHEDMEIITWVLSGELEHKDSEGHTGMWQSEMNPSGEMPV